MIWQEEPVTESRGDGSLLSHAEFLRRIKHSNAPKARQGSVKRVEGELVNWGAQPSL